MAQSLSTIDALLKEQYLPKIVDTFQEEKGVLGELMKRKQKARGGDTEVLVRLGRNNGIGFRADGDTLPSAGNSTWARHTVDPKLKYARIQVSGPAMARTEGGSAKAFLKAFVDEAKHTMSFFKKQCNVSAWGQEEGFLGQVASVTSSTITLDGPGTAGAFTHAGFNAGTRHFAWAGDALIDVLDGSDTGTQGQRAIIRAGGGITAVNHSTNTLTVDFDPTTGTAVADGDYIRLATGKTTSDDNPFTAWDGIVAALDDDTITSQGWRQTANVYHGLSRSTYPQLNAVVLKDDSALRDISESLLEDLCKSVYLNSGKDPMGGKYELRMSLGLHSNFVATQIPVKRFQSTDLKAGHSKITFNGIPVVPDVDCPYETVFLIDWDNFKFLEVDPLGWLDTDGRVLLRVANQDAYEARLRIMGEIVGLNVHSMGVLRNLNDDAYTLRS